MTRNHMMSLYRLMKRQVGMLVCVFFLPGGAVQGQTAKEGVLGRREGIVGLWMMGQSLCDGSESLPVVTPVDTGWGNYRFKRGVRTWLQADHGAEPEARAKKEFGLVPLTASVNGGLGETMANGLADHLKAAMLGVPQGEQRQGGPRFLVTYAGQGGRTIEELAVADISTDKRSPVGKQQGGGYYKTSLDDARKAKAQAAAMRTSFNIAALVWMQGEGNGGPTGGLMPTRWGTELPRPAGQEWYRDRLMAYRQQWSDDLRKITGQAGEIPMFTYQTLGPAGEAQLMAADADPHITLVGPHYMVPSAVNSRTPGGRHGDAIHLSADGERWYGEQVAKVMHRVLVKGAEWQPLRPLKAWLEAGRTSVVMEFVVPRPPLVLDEAFMPRQQVAMGGAFSSLNGFQVRDGTRVVVGITAVEVEGPTRVRIRLAAAMKAGGGCSVSCGQPYAGTVGTIASVRQGPAGENSVPTTELVMKEAAGGNVELLRREGAFFVANELVGALYAQAPVREVLVENGVTVLRLEDRERRNGVGFAAGQELRAMRPFSYSNLRDSDDEKAIFSFADAGYGKRAGQAYPLWNWCVLFSGFVVEER